MFSYRHFKKYVKRFFRELPKIAFISSILGFVFFLGLFKKYIYARCIYEN